MEHNHHENGTKTVEHNRKGSTADIEHFRLQTNESARLQLLYIILRDISKYKSKIGKTSVSFATEK